MLTEKLTSIAAAIREKGGTTEKLTLDAMPNAIAALSTGGGEDPIPNPYILTGDCERVFANGHHDWILENYQDRIQTRAIGNTGNMFQHTVVERITFDFDCSGNGSMAPYQMFAYATNLKEITGKIKNLKWVRGNGMFQSCYRLRYLPEFDYTTCQISGGNAQPYLSLFSNCYSLRSIPTELLKQLYYEKGTSSTYTVYAAFGYCATLDEIVGLPAKTGIATSNLFSTSGTCAYCYRLKRLKFDTYDDGTPYTVEWKNQTIDLSKYTGWAGYSTAHKEILDYNSGITADKEVKDKTTYEALKNDPDWWSRQFIYSRFNHDSAVELINTLPDTSAYIAAQGASNNIVKFYTNAGSNTDGGSVSQLTEEEVAVAVAKGWSITYGT